ncbi:MAG TPA: hypothetical protein VFU89_05210 [Rhabdochlamydiaceae bacterium]|nr:hypothetical protein [Rhabdochlamydiaceae bacterium]
MPKICPSMRRNPGHSSGFHYHAPRHTRTSRFSSYSTYSASEARKKNVFIQSSTDSNPISNLVQSVSHLVQRIFKADAYISTNWKDTGLIAADQMYGFSENLKTPGKKSIILPPNAFYVPIETRPASGDGGTLGSYYMPSILFEGAKEKDVIHYYLKNRKIELTLKQQLHPHENGRQNFEDFFASLKHYFVSNLQKPRQPIYLFSHILPPID